MFTITSTLHHFMFIEQGQYEKTNCLFGVCPAGWIGTVRDLYPVSNNVSFILRFRCLLVSEYNGLFFIFPSCVTLVFVFYILLYLACSRPPGISSTDRGLNVDHDALELVSSEPFVRVRGYVHFRS